MLFLDQSQLEINIRDMGISGINMSWSEGVVDVEQIFMLTISHGLSNEVFLLNESFYFFTAPEGAPPCEIYNFSVIATYVGATYTGAGCSVPSPVLSDSLST